MKKVLGSVIVVVRQGGKGNILWVGKHCQMRGTDTVTRHLDFPFNYAAASNQIFMLSNYLLPHEPAQLTSFHVMRKPSPCNRRLLRWGRGRRWRWRRRAGAAKRRDSDESRRTHRQGDVTRPAGYMMLAGGIDLRKRRQKARSCQTTGCK